MLRTTALRTAITGLTGLSAECSSELDPGSTVLVGSTGMLITATTLITVITGRFRVAGRHPSTTSMATRRGMEGVTQAPPVTRQAMSMPSLDIEAVVVVAAAMV